MNPDVVIRRAGADDAAEVAALAGELLNEIMDTIGVQAFHFDRGETEARLLDFLDREKYFVFVARHASAGAVGFVAMSECCALYAEGSFGTITELYVRPPFRSRQLGHALVAHAQAFASTRGWKRLEVTTPPLPEFERALAFYEREGFTITGGRKLKLAL